MIVIDASVLAPALGDDDADGDAARARLRGEDLAAPEIIDLEVTSVWRRTLADERRASLALADLADLPLRRAPHLHCWLAAGSYATTSPPTTPPTSRSLRHSTSRSSLPTRVSPAPAASGARWTCSPNSLGGMVVASTRRTGRDSSEPVRNPKVDG